LYGNGAGLSNIGYVSTLNNSGTVAGGNYGITNGNSGFGSTVGTINVINNQGSGIITGSIGIENHAQISSVNNSGLISGTTALINAFSTATYQGGANAGTIGTLQNDGQIVGTLYGIENQNEGLFNLVQNTGTVSGNTAMFNLGNITSLVNTGLITGTVGAISNSGSIGTLMNGSTGTISGGTFGIANGTFGLGATVGTINELDNQTSGTITGSIGIENYAQIGSVNNSGLLSGTTALNNAFGAGTNQGGTSSGTIGILQNDGQIIGALYGIENRSGALINLVQNTGAIGGNTAIFNLGNIPFLFNAGVIAGAAGAINNDGGTIGSIANSGIISGSVYGIYSANSVDNMGAVTGNGLIGNINNSGIIAANTAIFIGNGSAMGGTITNSGVIAGNIINNSSGDLNIVGATGSDIGILSGCGAVGTLSNGSTLRCIGAGAIGQLSNTLSNVNFTGNNLLNDNVSLNADGTGNVSVSAGILQVNNTISITGNYHQAVDATLLIGVSDNTNAAGSLNDSGYGRLVVSGIATISPSSSVNLKTTGSTYQFAAGQRFVVVDAATSVGTLSTNYNSASLTYSVTGQGGTGLTASGTETINGSRKDLVVSLATTGTGNTGTGNTGTGNTGTGSTGTGNTGTGNTGTGSTGTGSTGTGSTGTGSTGTGNTGTGSTGTGSAGTGSAGTGAGAGSTATITSTATSNPGGDDGGTGSSTVVSTTTAIQTPATNSNAVATLKGLSLYSGISNAALLNLYNAGQAINLESTTTANQAGDKLSSASQADTLRAAMSPTYDTLKVIGARIDAQRLGGVVAQTGVASGEAGASRALWGQAYGGHASQGERNNVAGYSANFGGLLIGADKAVNDRWHAGGAFSYSNTGINSRDDLSGNTTRVNGYGLFGYASYVAPKWYASFSAGAAYQNYKQNRQIDFTGFSGNTNASFGGSQLIAKGEVGYPMAVGAATLTPLASLTYAYMRQNGYTESGGNGAALSVDAIHATSVQSDLGAKIERAYTSHYGVLIPSMQVAWRHEYDHQKTSIAAQFAADPLGETRFTTQGATPVSDTAVLSAGLTLLRANNLSVTAQYTVQAGKGFLSQAGTVKLKQLF
jgi:outer membrane autotransporter protein